MFRNRGEAGLIVTIIHFLPGAFHCEDFLSIDFSCASGAASLLHNTNNSRPGKCKMMLPSVIKTEGPGPFDSLFVNGLLGNLIENQPQRNAEARRGLILILRNLVYASARLCVPLRLLLPVSYERGNEETGIV
jgi:hypothetical protein